MTESNKPHRISLDVKFDSVVERQAKPIWLAFSFAQLPIKIRELVNCRASFKQASMNI